MYQSDKADKIAREEAERRLKEAKRKLQEKGETEARNDARHDEVMAQLTLVRTQLSDVETQLSDTRQCLTDVREWGRLKEPDNTLVPQLTCREATLVEVDRDPIVEMCLSIDGYNTGRTSPTVRSNVGCFSGQIIEDLRPI